MAYELQARLSMVDRLSNPLSRATSQMERASRQSRKLGDSFSNVGRIAKSVTVGGVATLTAGLTAMTGYAAKVGMTFEEEMSKVQAVTGASAKEMKKMEEQAKQLGRSTQFSASAAAEGMSYLGMSGLKTKEITEAMPGVLNLAAAGQLELGRSADIASNLMSGFNKEAKDMPHITDVLAKAASSANTNVEQMGAAMSYVAPIADGLGISMEESAAAIGILSNAGIGGERAGTSLRAMMGQLQAATGSTKDALEGLGLSAKDVNPSVHSLSEIVKTLKDSGASAADAMALVGTEAGPGLAAMLTQGSGKLDEMTNSFKTADGAAANMAATMNDNLSGKVKRLKSAFEGFSLQVYGKVKPYLEQATQAGINFVDKLSASWPQISKGIDGVAEKVEGVYQKFKKAGGWISNNWPTVQNVIIGVATAALTLTAAMKTLSIINSVKALMATFKASTFAATWAARGFSAALLANPAVLIIAGITALVTAIVLLVKNFDWAKNAAMTAWNYMKAGALAVFEWMKPYIQSSMAFVMNVFNTVKNYIASIMPMITQIIRFAWSIIKPIFTHYLNSIWQVVKVVFTGLWNTISAAFTNIKNVISLAWTVISGTFKTALQLLTGDFKGAWNTMKETASTAINKLKTLFTDWVGGAKKIGKDFVNGIIDGFLSMWNSLKDTASKIWNSITGIFDKKKTVKVGVQANVNEPSAPANGRGAYASGLSNVSSDGLYRLHQGERVLTPEENQAYSGGAGVRSGGGNGGGAGVVISGNTFNVRQESDINDIGRAIVSELKRKGGLRA